MGKATLLTPVYLSVAWTLMTSYQLFTKITVDSITIFIGNYIPLIGAWMASRLDLIVFIHSFAWIFLLSSFIPSVLLGKQRGVLVQFSLCLTLAISANVVQGAVADISNGPLDQIFGLASLLRNPILAASYMSLPYILMAWFDIRGKRQKENLLNFEREQNDFPELFMVEDDLDDKEKIQEEYISVN
ncbi:hypothetical protein KJN74_00615 [Candidatus Bathyarchaeota archaeon]|nr:hypothetical protein [Candidatus Bathyarchaeota archaeon]